jgi:phospholipid transport system substrate-binding protein
MKDLAGLRRSSGQRSRVAQEVSLREGPMTAKGMKEGAEDLRRPREECAGIEATLSWPAGAAHVSRAESEQPAAAPADTAGETGQSPTGMPGLGLVPEGDGMNWFRTMLLIVVIVLGFRMDAWAGAPTDQVRSYTDRVQKVLEDPALTLTQRREAVRVLAAEAFDTTETAQRALGVHWQQRTPAERDQFVKLFANLLEQTYVSRIDEYGGEHLEYIDEHVDGDKATVRARVITSKGTEVAVESRVIQKGDRWLIYDILIENLSLISNYRSQFDRVIRTSSYGELVKRLQARVVALNEKDAKTPRGAAQPAR